MSKREVVAKSVTMTEDPNSRFGGVGRNLGDGRVVPLARPNQMAATGEINRDELMKQTMTVENSSQIAAAKEMKVKKAIAFYGEAKLPLNPDKDQTNTRETPPSDGLNVTGSTQVVVALSLTADEGISFGGPLK